ncbi:RDD family protein [Kribbella sp. NPDC051587]|uniref:RDD family protein n=1 Tax=Kribbella sp. NPDC051587 TaxID=3364119 RepID=UPI0037A4F88F
MSSSDDPTAVVGRRVLQGMLDRVLEMIGGVVVAVLAVVVLHRLGATPRTTIRGAGVGLIATMMVLSLGNELLLARRCGVTVGMEVFGLRLVTLAGERPSWKAVIIRYLLWQVDGLFFAVIGIVMMVCTPRHQRLGDLVAGTLVVRSRRSLDQAVLPRPDGELGAVPQSELALRAGEVRLDGGQRQS